MEMKERMLVNTIYRTIQDCNLDEILIVWKAVKSVCPRSVIKEALKRGDSDYDGNVPDLVTKWIPCSEQGVIEAEERLRRAREHLAIVREDTKEEESRATKRHETWKDLKKVL